MISKFKVGDIITYKNFENGEHAYIVDYDSIQNILMVQWNGSNYSLEYDVEILENHFELITDIFRGYFGQI